MLPLPVTHERGDVELLAQAVESSPDGGSPSKERRGRRGTTSRSRESEIPEGGCSSHQSLFLLLLDQLLVRIRWFQGGRGIAGSRRWGGNAGELLLLKCLKRRLDLELLWAVGAL